MASSPIEHEGIVQGIDENGVRVMIMAHSACGACRSKKICGISETKEKIINVKNSSRKPFRTGDKVIVEMNSSLGMTAVFFGYVFPFIVLILSLIILTRYTQSEPLSGLITLGMLGVYYLILYFFRNALKRKFTFSVKSLPSY
jgi:positive regulator of sigma E activity